VRAVVQRVSHAAVAVDGEVCGEIGRGLCVLVGAGPGDHAEQARHLAGRVATLRVFADAAGRMNLDLAQLDPPGSVLVLSQFTLYADTSHGHRPSFIGAGRPEQAERLCAEFCDELRRLGLEVAEGRFAAHMQVSIDNDGPVTLVLSSGEPPWPADAG
jgi:D-tyrosyl-tRNA(Tyr) deacylase